MPLVYLGTGWFIGIALALALQLPIEFLLLAFLVPIGGLFLWRNDRRARRLWISISFAIAGAIWFTYRLPHFDQNSLSTYNGIGLVTIEGVIDGPPDERDTYVNLRVTGQLTAPPEFATFSYADFLARQGVYSLIDRPQVKVLEHGRGNPILSIIYGFRNRAFVVIQRFLPEPQASLLSGILLGVDAGLPVVVQEDFRVTGTSHLVAISA
jgi:predicted membrane metal-binding protein